MRLLGKTAIVTGGASGIGREGCLRFAAEGARVVIADIDDTRGESVVQEIMGSGGEALFVHTDVSQATHVSRMVDAAKSAYSRIDILFNNAFWYKVAPALELTEEAWNRTISVTLTGTFLCCKHVLPEMIAAQGGSIINTASVGSVVGFAAHPAYNAAKGGIVMLTKNLAIDYGRHGIRVNAISPGIIETPVSAAAIRDPEMNEFYMKKCLVGRVGQPADVAAMAVFLASDESSFVTGANMAVDGGWTAK
ncbi:SDR family NAD(P)-dependent oxidoreductase [Paenibacillus eucommiae]|uniref:NAD(P)-dependent dehydrogenase (Short-subunit alcohol dehydrogenase family) n=1 Tax=Paenibacillus eucommiae TaxID=1355755 RepID=A0ABS4J639_9BACL|nr:glucose 1-dehydrogenase [Paenibacillus eucommiae]MBP1995317.1 NAD(P)-dependent dehydrogenase (short-subunit alcohol dehydrogenase family) [Paenibacillus eucommiae]